MKAGLVDEPLQKLPHIDDGSGREWQAVKVVAMRLLSHHCVYSNVELLQVMA